VRSHAFREAAEGEAHALAARVRESLEAVAGVARVTHSERTGSLLIEYEPGLAEPDAIIAHVARIAGLVSPFDRSGRLRPTTSPAELAIEATRELNAVVYEATGLKADLRLLAPAALAALSAYSFVFNKKEPRLPRWDNLLYWSYNVFSQLHQREIQRGAVLETPRPPRVDPDGEPDNEDAEP
jgi:hypothetical protein